MTKRKLVTDHRPIVYAINRLSSEQLFALIEKLEGIEKRTDEQRLRLLLAHNAMNERLWQKQRQSKGITRYET